jgi:hypothetical protein
MRKPFAVLALAAAALVISNIGTRAVECGNGSAATAAACSLISVRIKGWIKLHRPDGKTVHIQTDQIVFVMSTANTGANTAAQSKIQMVNGFADVLESVDAVMQAIKEDNWFAFPGPS